MSHDVVTDRLAAMPTTDTDARPGPIAPVTGDDASQAWVAALAGSGPERRQAEGRLHELLLRAAHFELNRRRGQLGGMNRDEVDEMALEIAHDAQMSVLRRLSDFEGRSRFTTWVYKFAILQASVAVRRREWEDREIPAPVDISTAAPIQDFGPPEQAEHRELLQATNRAIRDELTPRQRTVLVALAIQGVPLDVLAERMSTSRNALYKTLHDARRKLRASLTRQGLLGSVTESGEK